MSRGWSANIDTRSYMAAMRILGKQVLPTVMADTLNGVAAANAKQMKKNVEKRMIVRTKFTTNSIRQDRHARGSNISRMFSRVGSVSPYLAIHDEGGIIKAERKKIPIPTLQARVSRSKQRRIARRYAMNRMDIGESQSYGKFFMGKPRGGNRRVGIYERHHNNKRLTMIRNIESEQVKIDPNHWFSDSLKKYGTSQFIQAQFKKHAKRRLRRFQ